jgi:hypothetical protein
VSWKESFSPDYAVPDLIIKHMRVVDTSWHNDACPSFAATGEVEGCTPRLWVEHPDPAERASESAHRFTVTDTAWGEDENGRVRYEGDDAFDALAMLIKAQRETEYTCPDCGKPTEYVDEQWRHVDPTARCFLHAAREDPGFHADWFVSHCPDSDNWRFSYRLVRRNLAAPEWQTSCAYGTRVEAVRAAREWESVTRKWNVG